jgi:dTDP-4-amino-4,6-dideoxygalactose transaminase
MKSNLDDLAIFGNAPAFNTPLHVGRPNIGDREKLFTRINDILDHRWLTNHGPYVNEFEERIANFLGVKHCIAMCNATIALEIAIRAAGLSGEVIVPSMTFVATAHALQWQEITPVFCDIDPVSCNIDPQRIEELITPRTTGIIGVHLWSRPCDIDAMTENRRTQKFKIIVRRCPCLRL